jgi:hypothetical protein
VPFDSPVVVSAIDGMTVCMAAPTKNEPSPASTIIAASTRSRDTSRNTRAAATTPTRSRAVMPSRVCPLNRVRAIITVSGR